MARNGRLWRLNRNSSHRCECSDASERVSRERFHARKIPHSAGFIVRLNPVQFFFEMRTVLS